MAINYFKIRDNIGSIFFYWCFHNQFKHWGRNTKIFKPLRIEGMKNISLGKDVRIKNGSWMAALPLTGASDCSIVVGDGTVIGHYNHIYSTKCIVIGRNVLMADKVYISDNLHEYIDINIPILRQPVRQIGVVHIGDGSWIGENACIMGARVGKQCVIGANSVVTKDIPDYCVAVGAPARVIKHYSFDSLRWELIQ